MAQFLFAKMSTLYPLPFFAQPTFNPLQLNIYKALLEYLIDVFLN